MASGTSSIYGSDLICLDVNNELSERKNVKKMIWEELRGVLS